ncbi:MAG: MBL fold metallo-hydrolase [Pirellulales bacterium]|nr:MBL fold metallo-hydrolase [Pirellulales bacterium]
MKLQFLGATRQVTGSQFLLEADGVRLLVDCGMFQEREFQARNWEPSLVKPQKLDLVLLTHAHVDHCGLVPKLVQEGYRGPILTTAASADLVELVLRDAAEIQAEDASFKRKRHRKEGRQVKHPVKPLYAMKDVDRTVRQLQTAAYNEEVKVNEHVTAVFHDAGHILGSAIIEVRVRGNGEPRKFLFTGDLGQMNKPIVRDPETFTQADYVVMESTYGDRNHETAEDVELQLERIIKEAAEAGGAIVIPIFAIERAQEIIFYLNRLLFAGKIPEMPVFLDSPMAADVNEVFRDHRDCFDQDALDMLSAGRSIFKFPALKVLRSQEESQKINGFQGPCIIMSTSGMCTAGRIKHHLAQRIARPETTVLFVGYQARGTLGRQILDGNHSVRIHGRSLLVRARIAQLQGISGHADRDGLTKWLGYLQTPPRRIFVAHGDEEVSLSFAKHVRETLHFDAVVPDYRQVVELT